MEICHLQALTILRPFDIVSTPFLNCDVMRIKTELKRVNNMVREILNECFDDVPSAIQRIPESSEKLSSFMNLVHHYGTNCHREGRIFANILQGFLCEKINNDQITFSVIYHLLANYGLLMCNCLLLYVTDKSRKGHDPIDIPVIEALRNMTNANYRFSQNHITLCISKSDTSLYDLKFARTLINQSLTMRRILFSKICPVYYNKVTKDPKAVANH